MIAIDYPSEFSLFLLHPRGRPHMALTNALELLDGFCAAGIAIEITHRSKRRLFGLAGLAPLRDEAEALPPSPLPPERPMMPIERRTIDYSELERGMAHLDQVVRDARRTLDVLARGDAVQPLSVKGTGPDDPTAGA